MNPGLFASSCPECGGELAIDRFGSTSTCAPCRRSYLNRFGYLIPIEFHEAAIEQVEVPAPLG